MSKYSSHRQINIPNPLRRNPDVPPRGRNIAVVKYFGEHNQRIFAFTVGFIDAPSKCFAQRMAERILCFDLVVVKYFFDALIDGGLADGFGRVRFGTLRYKDVISIVRRLP